MTAITPVDIPCVPVQLSRDTASATYRPIGTLRFGLALLVLIQHGVYLLNPSFQHYLFSVGFGIMAVTVFFVISGFIVAEANETFYRGRTGAFMVNRLLRIVPPYLAALAVQVAVDTWLYHAGVFAPVEYALHGSPLQPMLLVGGLLALIPGFHTKMIAGQDFEFFGLVWTLKVEMLFYLAAAAVYFFLRCKLWIGQVIAVALYLAYAVFHIGPEQMNFIPFFMVGVFLFRVWKSRQIDTHYLTMMMWVGFAMGSLVILKQRVAPVLTYQVPGMIMLLGLFGVLAFSSIKPQWKRIDTILGGLSYPLYLNHYIVVMAISNVAAGRTGFGLYGLAIVVSLGLAFVMNYLVETPTKQLRDSVRGTTL